MLKRLDKSLLSPPVAPFPSAPPPLAAESAGDDGAERCCGANSSAGRSISDNSGGGVLQNSKSEYSGSAWEIGGKVISTSPFMAMYLRYNR